MYEILRDSIQKYFYIWNNEINEQVCDDDGNPLRFKSLSNAEEYLENNLNEGE